MTRSEILKELFKKSILPIAITSILFAFSQILCTSDGITNYISAWIICGIPFGISKLRTWFFSPGGSLGVSAAIFVLNFFLAGVIGGVILIWKLIVAVYYIPLSIVRFVNAN